MGEAEIVVGADHHQERATRVARDGASATLDTDLPRLIRRLS